MTKVEVLYPGDFDVWGHSAGATTDREVDVLATVTAEEIVLLVDDTDVVLL